MLVIPPDRCPPRRGAQLESWGRWLGLGEGRVWGYGLAGLAFREASSRGRGLCVGRGA